MGRQDKLDLFGTIWKDLHLLGPAYIASIAWLGALGTAGRLDEGFVALRSDFFN